MQDGSLLKLQRPNHNQLLQVMHLVWKVMESTMMQIHDAVNPTLTLTLGVLFTPQ